VKIVDFALRWYRHMGKHFGELRCMVLTAFSPEDKPGYLVAPCPIEFGILEPSMDEALRKQIAVATMATPVMIELTMAERSRSNSMRNEAAISSKPAVSSGVKPASWRRWHIRSRPSGVRWPVSMKRYASIITSTLPATCLTQADGGQVSAGTNLASIGSYRTLVTLPSLIFEIRSSIA
jgi:hypothetical protein